ncbi:MAG: tetratricopeptide repeat protein [Myxococcota bacterium]
MLRRTFGSVLLALTLAGGCDGAGSTEPSSAAAADPEPPAAPKPEPKPEREPKAAAEPNPSAPAGEEAGAGKPGPAGVALAARVDAWVEQAGAHARDNKLTEAAALYQKALDQVPDRADAAAGLARVYLEQDKLKEALRLFAIATPALEDNAKLWRDVGYAHAGLEQYDESAKAYAKAHALAPDDVVIALAHGRAVRLSGKPEAAITLLEAVATADPKLQYVYTELGDAQREAGKLDDALKSYMRAQMHYASDKKARAGAALVYEAKGETDRALDEWSSYIRMDCCSKYSKEVALKKVVELRGAPP